MSTTFRTDVQLEADKLRHEAKVLLKRMFNIAEGESNGNVERIVDCIVGAAILEISDMNSRMITALTGTKEGAKHG